MTRDIFPSVYKFSRRVVARHKCNDCGVNVIETGDYCMLSPDIWKDRLGLGWTDNLCVACIEKRLGRKLGVAHSDFVAFPSVEGYSISDALAERYGFKKPKKKAKAKGGTA